MTGRGKAARPKSRSESVSEAPKANVPALRLRHAALMVGGAIAFVAASGVAEDAWDQRPSMAAEAVLAFDAEDLIDLKTPEAASSVPEFLSREVGIPPQARDMQWDEASCTVGFSIPGPSQEAWRSIREALASRGWKEQEGSTSFCAGFWREDGAVRWLFVTTVEVGDGVSAVVQYQGEDA